VLTPGEKSRYSRHLLLPEFGEEGQERLKQAKVLVVGAGGLGSPSLLYLAASGVGTIGIVDFDVVETNNLHRQVLYNAGDVGQMKVEAAVRNLERLNPAVSIVSHPVRLTSENAIEIISQYDLVLDGTDNFATRYLVNDACVLTHTPNVYASIYRYDGQVSVFCTENGPCYRCVFPEPPPPGSVPSCAEGGVLGVLPGLLGTLQATEAVKWLAGLGESLVGRLLLVDALDMTFKTLKIQADPECFCGGLPAQGVQSEVTETAHINHPLQPDPMFFGPSIPSISVVELQDKKSSNEDFLLLDVRQPEELTIADIGGTLIPMDELPTRLDEVKAFKDRDIIVMCRTGARSAMVVQWLQNQGLERVFNLDGGIAAWSRQIDSSIALY
jgi:sulfur-carrier protein adenylyltransferase/sulfurtransferase